MDTKLTPQDAQIELEQPIQEVEAQQLNEVSNEEYREGQVKAGIVRLEKYQDKTPITKKSLEDFKARANAVKINGVDDKEGMKLAKEIKSTLMKTRTNLENVRKELVKDSVYYQKQINERAKELTAEISEIETPLAEKIKAIEDEKEKAKREAELLAEKKANERINSLIEQGMLFTGEYYEIGAVSISVVDVRNMSDETFKVLFEKVVETAQKLAAEKAEKDEADRKAKLQTERAMTLLKNGFSFDGSGYFVGEVVILAENELSGFEQSIFDAKLNTGVAELKRIKDAENAEKQALADKQKELDEKAKEIENDRLRQFENMVNSRIKKVVDLGLFFDGVSNYTLQDVNIAIVEIKTLEDAEFDKIFVGMSNRVSEIKEQEAKAKEAQAKADADAILAKQKADQEAKEAAEKLAKEQAPDKEKANQFYNDLIAVISSQPILKDATLKSSFELDNAQLLEAIEALKTQYIETEN